MRLADSERALKATVASTRFLGRFSSTLGGIPAYRLWFIPWRVPVSERGLAKQARWLEPTLPFILMTSVGRIAECLDNRRSEPCEFGGRPRVPGGPFLPPMTNESLFEHRDSGGDNRALALVERLGDSWHVTDFAACNGVAKRGAGVTP